MFLYQTCYHTILSTSAKTFLFLVNSSFFYNTLKFKKFPPSWFMAAHWKRLGIAVNDVILILNFSKKTKFKTVKDDYLKYLLSWMLSKSFKFGIDVIRQTKMVETLSNFRVIYNIIWIVRAFWLVYKCVFIALWSTTMAWAMWFDCLRVVRI